MAGERQLIIFNFEDGIAVTKYLMEFIAATWIILIKLMGLTSIWNQRHAVHAHFAGTVDNLNKRWFLLLIITALHFIVLHLY